MCVLSFLIRFFGDSVYAFLYFAPPRLSYVQLRPASWLSYLLRIDVSLPFQLGT